MNDYCDMNTQSIRLRNKWLNNNIGTFVNHSFDRISIALVTKTSVFHGGHFFAFFFMAILNFGQNLPADKVGRSELDSSCMFAGV